MALTRNAQIGEEHIKSGRCAVFRMPGVTADLPTPRWLCAPGWKKMLLQFHHTHDRERRKERAPCFLKLAIFLLTFL